MANDMQPKGKNKALTVIIIAIVVLLIIILAVVAMSQKDSTTAPVDQTSDAPAAVEGDEGLTPEEVDPTVTDEEQIPEALVGAEAEVEGGSLVSTDNKVITQEGEEAKNDVEPMSPEAPQQTAPVEVEELPETVTQVSVSAAGFEPAEIRVSADAPTTISVTSSDTFTHIFKFEDESLSAVAVGVAPGETRAITFQAPAPGEYTYFCDVPGHAARGETGVMIVE